MGNSQVIMKTLIVLCASLALSSGLCHKDSEPGMRKRGKGKGKGKGKGQKKCPTVEEGWNKVQEEMGDELCVFQQIGWLDESYEFNNETAMADIATLPEGVSMALGDNDMGECVESVMDYMGKDQETLMGMGYLTAGIKCFLDGFMDACGEHVKTELMDAYFSQPAGRK